MSFAAYLALLLAFLLSIGAAGWLILTLFEGRNNDEAERAATVAEWVNTIQCGCFVFASGILLHALIRYDFSLVYVYSYTDRLLPLFYRITAFWGGQAGSLLFWALCIVLFGVLFQTLPRYARLGVSSRLWYWLFYFLITAFFCIILLTWSNPFALFDSAPADGRGLNPLLQNPGMIFHPPLLFLGYAGFTIPACLALAQAMSRAWEHGEDDWSLTARPLTMLSWLFLSAGLLLGAWWSYMELGWGGYWGWDPVENASLIPWLLATAAIHTILIQNRRNKLHRSSVALMALTFVSTIFATYLVRSGILQSFSLHSFSDGGVGLPMLVFILLGTVLSLWCAAKAKHADAGPVESLGTREGFIILTVWVLLTLSVVVLVATLWPVITAPFGKPEGLDASFYNRVCLPLFAILAILLVMCPWLKWRNGIRDVRRLGTSAGVFIASSGAFWGMGYQDPVAALSMGASLGIILGCLYVFIEGRSYRNLPGIAACGVHLGVALIVLGVAFSGPFKVEQTTSLSAGQSTTVGPFDVTLKGISDGQAETYGYIVAELEVTQADSLMGTVHPERRYYYKWKNTFAEADTIPSLRNELYASLLSVDANDVATLRLSANPLINWIWIGSILVCLFPCIGFMRRKREDSDDAAL